MNIFSSLPNIGKSLAIRLEKVDISSVDELILSLLTTTSFICLSFFWFYTNTLR